jgi:hypothetical protein
MLYPLSYLGLARAAVLSNDTANARKAYNRFLELWKNADAVLRPVIDAHNEIRLSLTLAEGSR